MAAPIHSPATCEVHSSYDFSAQCERPAEIHKQIFAVYGNVMNRKNVTKWCGESSEGRTDVHDEQRNGRPSLIFDNLLQEIGGEIRANWRVTIRELHHIIPEVSKTTIHEAVTEKLGYRKLWALWVPKMLTDDHKTKWMGFALKFLKRYAQEWDEFLDSVVTGEETWVFRHTPESNWWDARISHDVGPRAGGRLLWLWDTEAGSKTS
jgi:hypothetical protein